MPTSSLKPSSQMRLGYPHDAPDGQGSPRKAKEALQRLLFPTNAEKTATSKPNRRHQTAETASRKGPRDPPAGLESNKRRRWQTVANGAAAGDAGTAGAVPNGV
jgi:hypothetical protein